MDHLLKLGIPDLRDIDHGKAQDVTRRLYVYYVGKTGEDPGKVSVSLVQNVSDGGIDGYVEPLPAADETKLIKKGGVALEIKTGDTFDPRLDGQVKKLLFGEKNAKKDETELNRDDIRTSLSAKLEKGYAYVVLCFGRDFVGDDSAGKAEKLIKKYLRKCDFGDTEVHVLGQSVLINYIEEITGLVLKLKRTGVRLSFLVYDGWAKHAKLKGVYKCGDTHYRWMERYEKQLEREDAAVHLRISGPKDIGKTKFALEATGRSRFKDITLYFGDPARLEYGGLVERLLIPGNDEHQVIVVDDCDAASAQRIWDYLAYVGDRIKLVTIGRDNGNIEHGQIFPIEIPRLEDEHLAAIIYDGIKSVMQDEEAARKDALDLAPQCEGLPGKARKAIRNYEAEKTVKPSERVRRLETEADFDQVIFGGIAESDDERYLVHVVFRHIALFERFGIEFPVEAEGKAVHRKIHAAEPRITWGKFKIVVDSLRKQGVLKGEKTVRFTRTDVQLYGWRGWWDTYGTEFEYETFAEGLPPELLTSFHAMFKYAEASPVSAAAVKRLLNLSGPFADPAYIWTGLGAPFFVTLTEADPASALRYLKANAAHWTPETLSQAETRGWEIVHALEMIAYHAPLFEDAARLLLKLNEVAAGDVGTRDK